MKLKNLLNENLSYGFIMAKVDDDNSKKILDFNYKFINENCLYIEEGDYGRETNVHCTIKYGLTERYSKKQMKHFLYDVVPFNIEINEIGIFENDKFDVIKFNVESKDLRKLNEIFSTLPNNDEHKEYKPHITLAYIQKGTGNQFIKTSKRKGYIPIRTLIYSDGINGNIYYNL